MTTRHFPVSGLFPGAKVHPRDGIGYLLEARDWALGIKSQGVMIYESGVLGCASDLGELRSPAAEPVPDPEPESGGS